MPLFTLKTLLFTLLNFNKKFYYCYTIWSKWDYRMLKRLFLESEELIDDSQAQSRRKIHNLCWNKTTLKYWEMPGKRWGVSCMSDPHLKWKGPAWNIAITLQVMLLQASF